MVSPSLSLEYFYYLRAIWIIPIKELYMEVNVCLSQSSHIFIITTL